MTPETPAHQEVRRWQRSAPTSAATARHQGRVIECASPIDVCGKTVLFTVAPYGHGGWHTHPGPAIFTVSQGTLTMYDGNDPSCTPQVFPAGTGSIEADTASHIHILRNETSEPVETVVTFLVPLGAESPRGDLDDPGHCAFPF